MEKKSLRNLLIGASAVVGICCAGQPAECLFGKTVNYCCEKDGSSAKAAMYTTQFNANKISLSTLKAKVCALTGPCAKPTAAGASCSNEDHHVNNAVNKALPAHMTLDDKFCPAL